MSADVRTDVHRVGSLVPAHYSFVEVLDLYAGSAKDDVVTLVSVARVPHGWTSFAQDQQRRIRGYGHRVIGDRPNLSQCSICGAHIRYAVVWEYRPSDRCVGVITTGLDCAASMGSAQLSEINDQVGALKEFVAGMRRSARSAEAAAVEAANRVAVSRYSAADARRALWLQESPDNRAASDFLRVVVTNHVTDAVSECMCFCCDIAQSLVERGTLSSAQVEAVLMNARRSDQSGNLPAPRYSIPTGNVSVVGSVVSIKPRGHGTDGSQGVLVRAKGFRVWFVLPAMRALALSRDAKIRFQCKAAPSSSDVTFLIASEIGDIEILEDSRE